MDYIKLLIDPNNDLYMDLMLLDETSFYDYDKALRFLYQESVRCF